jgi:hypothetical protein
VVRNVRWNAVPRTVVVLGDSRDATALGTPRAIDDAFVDLVHADAEFVRAQFATIVAANWDVTRPVRLAGTRPDRAHRLLRTLTAAARARSRGRDDRLDDQGRRRQRSPPTDGGRRLSAHTLGNALALEQFVAKGRWWSYGD